MADKVISLGETPLKAVDNGDGTYALAVSATVEVPAPAGGATEAKQDSQITQETAINTVLGATTGAKVITDANGTIQQYLRGLVHLLITLFPAALGQGTMAQSLRVVLPSDQAAVPTKDAGPSWTSAHGVSGVPFTSADAQTAAAVTSAPTAGQKIVVTDLFVSNNSAVAIQFTFVEETSATVIFGPVALAAGTCAQFTPRSRGWKLPVADKKLMVDASAAGNIMVDAHYYSEA